MTDFKSKHCFGSKDGIEVAKTSGLIDNCDVLFLDNGEIGWLNKNNETVINTPRTQEPIEVNGVTGLGITDGSTISAGKTIDEIVKMLVQKAIPATYTKPTITIANNGGQASGSVEAGTSFIPKLKATFAQNDAGNLTAISILQGSDSVADGATSPLVYSGEEIVVGDETITFKATATYEDGPVKKNNLGDESTENWFAGGTVNSSNYSIVGQRNLFYGTGVGTIPELTSDVVRGLANKKLNPRTLRDVNNVTYVEANDSGMATNFTQTLVNVADARGEENGLKSYKVYTYAMAVPAAATMTFKVTI